MNLSDEKEKRFASQQNRGGANDVHIFVEKYDCEFCEGNVKFMNTFE